MNTLPQSIINAINIYGDAQAERGPERCRGCAWPFDEEDITQVKCRGCARAALEATILAAIQSTSVESNNQFIEPPSGVDVDNYVGRTALDLKLDNQLTDKTMTTTKNFVPVSQEQAHKYQQEAESWLAGYKHFSTNAFTWCMLAEYAANRDGLTLYHEVPSKLYPNVSVPTLIYQIAP